jgi:hypothetical protein
VERKLKAALNFPAGKELPGIVALADQRGPPARWGFSPQFNGLQYPFEPFRSIGVEKEK